ncbi:MAG: glycine C-acetyltransferase [Candidatus Latescibacterota bacterium]
MYANPEFFEEPVQKSIEDGTYKEERIITSPQGAVIRLGDGAEVINFCSNNYLGLSNHPDLISAAKKALDEYGYGMSSVRFICGTLDIHKQLEQSVSDFLCQEETVLYSSCFDANGGLFETLLNEQDVVISDELNHASIIDGVRLCKARRMIYKNNDMNQLESRLKEAAGARIRMIATDGVFSMDGIVANLKDICGLADRYGALVMVDDSHAAGVIGETGRGSAEANGVLGRVDIITGTFGKALGGASGGFTSTRKGIARLLRQKSRPYLFSNTLCPVVTAASLRAIEIINRSPELIQRLDSNSRLFRTGMTAAGFRPSGEDHPIVPVMYGNAKLAKQTAEALLLEGIYVIAFSFPVVPRDKARIRVQLTAAHTVEQIKKAVEAFATIRDRITQG